MNGEQYRDFMSRFLQPATSTRPREFEQHPRAIKRAVNMSRPTEAIGVARAAACELLETWRRDGDVECLAWYVEIVPDGYTFDSDFEVQTIKPESRPTLLKGCVQCGARKPMSSYVSGVRQPNGTIRIRRHHYCEACRERAATRQWWNVLADDGEAGGRFAVRLAGREADGRRGARRRDDAA